jgi:hypothetical protein
MIVEIGKGVQQGLLCPFIRSVLWGWQFLAWLEAKPKAEDRSFPYLLRKLVQAEMAREPKAKKPKR